MKKEKELKEEQKDSKRTKSDEYYDEFTKENIVIDDLEEEDEVEVVKTEKQKDVKTKAKLTKNQFILLNIQFILSIITLVLAIVYFFKKNVMFALQISLGLTMLITGFNNLKVYKRKAFTILYFLLGIALLILAVINILGI